MSFKKVNEVEKTKLKSNFQLKRMLLMLKPRRFSAKSCQDDNSRFP